MSVRLHSLKIAAIALVALFACYLLLAWLALPRLLESQAREYIADKTGHRLTLDRPEFNPFTLTLRVSNLHLAKPDGKPLFGFRELMVNLSASSLWRRAFVFDAIRLDDPEATIILERDGRLNWSEFAEALVQRLPYLTLPRMRIQSLTLSGGRIDFTDQRTGFATRMSPLELELSEISTLPNERDRYRISATTAFGARLLWQGRTMLNPFDVAGNLAIENLELARLGPYVRRLLPVAIRGGVAVLSADYRISYAGGRLGLLLENLAARATDLRVAAKGGASPTVTVNMVEAKNGRFDFAARKLALGTLALVGSQIDLPGHAGALELGQIGGVTLQDSEIDMAAHTVTFRRIALQDGRFKAVRNSKERIEALDALRAATASPSSPARSSEAAARTPWHFQVNKLDLSGFSASFRDEAVAPAAELTLEDIAVSADGVSDDLSSPLPVRASCRARDGGRLEASGKIVLSEPVADLHLSIADLALKPAQPYIAALARLTLSNGSVSAEGRVTFGKDGAKYRGAFAVRDLRLLEAGTRDVFLAWKFLGSRDIELTPTRLEIMQLDVDRPSGKLIISQDKSVNLTRILHKATPAASGGATDVSAAERKTPGFLVSIDRTKITKGELDYADYSLVLPFATHIHEVRGFLNGVSSRPGTRGQIELDGQVEDYGVARALGEVYVFDPAEFTDIKVQFSNVEMTRLSPYSITFAGRRINSGKLSLSVDYRIIKHQLRGENQVIMDRLVLGEHVKSPEAVDLPLDLAIALLEDSDGRIDLGLPVSGSLDDPKFSYGAVIWKSFLNVFGMIAIAPFRALGALFGGSRGAKIENVYFDPGGSEISPPQHENIIRLAGVLNKRPLLTMTVHGTYSDADRTALQDLQVRRAVAIRTGWIPGNSEDDPGPIATSSPKVQGALESLFSERIGTAELLALKEGFRKANPGKMPESAAGKLLSRLSDVFRSKRTLSEQELELLKGSDFYSVLFRRLRDRETVPDARLQTLAQSRGQLTFEALKAAAAPADRLLLGAPAKVASDLQGVPVKLDLLPTRKAVGSILPPPVRAAAAG